MSLQHFYVFYLELKTLLFRFKNSLFLNNYLIDKNSNVFTSSNNNKVSNNSNITFQCDILGIEIMPKQ